MKLRPPQRLSALSAQLRTATAFVAQKFTAGALLIGLLLSVVAALVFLWHGHPWYALLSIYGYSGVSFGLLVLVESVSYRRSSRGSVSSVSATETGTGTKTETGTGTGKAPTPPSRNANLLVS